MVLAKMLILKDTARNQTIKPRTLRKLHFILCIDPVQANQHFLTTQENHCYCLIVSEIVQL